MWIRIAVAAAVVISCLLGAYAFYDRNIAEHTFRQHLRELKQRQQLPPELQNVDIETVDLSQHDLELPAAVLFRHSLAYLLAKCWYLWIPAVTLACIVLAWLAQLAFKRA